MTARAGNRRLVAAALLAVMTLGAAATVPSVAAADPAKDLRKAQALLDDKKYDAAYAEYLRHATEKDNALASFTVALFHQLGWGRAVDPVAACRWHERAAKGAIPASEERLGHCLVDGVHRAADPAEAATWFRRAADHGIISALCALGDLHIEGRGVAKDPAAGLALCEQAARRGNPAAMVRLGQHHLAGAGGKIDMPAAIGWLRAASERNSAVAPFLLGELARDGRAEGATPAIATTWFEIAGSRGHVPAYFQTGKLYFDQRIGDGEGGPVPERLAKAYLWLSAAQKRSADAAERAAAARMLAVVAKEMPAGWVADLDRKVAAHLEKFGA